MSRIEYNMRMTLRNIRTPVFSLLDIRRRPARLVCAIIFTGLLLAPLAALPAASTPSQTSYQRPRFRRGRRWPDLRQPGH